MVGALSALAVLGTGCTSVQPPPSKALRPDTRDSGATTAGSTADTATAPASELEWPDLCVPDPGCAPVVGCWASPYTFAYSGTTSTSLEPLDLFSNGSYWIWFEGDSGNLGCYTCDETVVFLDRSGMWTDEVQYDPATDTLQYPPGRVWTRYGEETDPFCDLSYYFL